MNGSFERIETLCRKWAQTSFPDPVSPAISIGVAYFYRITDVRLHAALVVLMSGFLALVLFMITINDRPFYGTKSIAPAPYELILTHLMDLSK